jgi:hypothetical protein
LTIALDTAQHFVFDLDEVSGVEKVVGQEQLVGNLVGMRIQGAVLAKRQIFETGVVFLGHEEIDSERRV